MSTFTGEYIAKIVSEVAAQYRLNQWRFVIRKHENIGQNYFGVIIPLTLYGDNENGDVDLPLVLKLAPTDERYRISGAVTLMFRREIYVYSVLLQKYREYITSYTIRQFIIPAVYFVEDAYCKEVIVMQDMCGAGYKPYTQKSFLDLDHIKVALESLAQLHALSFVLKHNCSDLYNKIKEICAPLTEQSNKRYIDIMTDRLIKAISKFENTSYVPLLETLKINCGQMFDIAVEKVNGTCICHGDVWKENILFKYDENNKPISACLIDYQTTRLSSPAFDALYLIISSTDTFLRKDHYYSLLDIYYDMFCLVLQNSHLDAQLLYPRDKLDHDLKAVAPACFITANTALWLSNGLQEEGHVRSKHIWTTPEEKDTAVIKYRSVIQSIIDDFYGYGYFLVDAVQQRNYLFLC